MNHQIKMLLKGLYYIFTPQTILWGGRDIELTDSFIIPKRYSGEIGLWIDLSFYGYLFMAITSWFYSYITLHTGFYFMMVSAFFIGSTIIPMFSGMIYSDIRNNRKT